MATHATLIKETFPMSRPKILIRTARMAARLYRRDRDLPGAVPGLLAEAPAQILPRLVEEEERCETARRARAAGYRPARHVQILAALLAETAAGQVKASGSAALRSAM